MPSSSCSRALTEIGLERTPWAATKGFFPRAAGERVGPAGGAVFQLGSNDRNQLGVCNEMGAHSLARPTSGRKSRFRKKADPASRTGSSSHQPRSGQSPKRSGLPGAEIQQRYPLGGHKHVVMRATVGTKTGTEVLRALRRPVDSSARQRSPLLCTMHGANQEHVAAAGEVAQTLPPPAGGAQRSADQASRAIAAAGRRSCRPAGTGSRRLCRRCTVPLGGESETAGEVPAWRQKVSHHVGAADLCL